MSIVRELLSTRDADYHAGGSGAELRVLRVLRRARLPRPVQQYRVKLNGKTYFLDWAWPQYKVFGEYYGLFFHQGAGAVAYDSERITALSSAGWLPLIFTEETSDRDIVERTIAALRNRGVGREVGA